MVMVILLPLAGTWARLGREKGCAFDGEKIVPNYRVRIVDHGNQSHAFCSVACATRWLEGKETEPREIYVTDEVSGREISASVASYVHSQVVTMKVSGNMVHVYENRADAENHARLWKGRFVRPWQRSEEHKK